MAADTSHGVPKSLYKKMDLHFLRLYTNEAKISWIQVLPSWTGSSDRGTELLYQGPADVFILNTSLH